MTDRSRDPSDDEAEFLASVYELILSWDVPLKDNPQNHTADTVSDLGQEVTEAADLDTGPKEPAD